MPSELLETLVTTEDRELLRVELEQLKSAVFRLKDNTFPEVLKHQVRSQIAAIIEREIRTSEQEPEKYVNDVLKQLDSAAILELTIAFEPTQANVEQIAQEATKLLGQAVLLKIAIQPQLMGGAIITWQGRYHDATLRKKFTEVVDQQLAKI